MRPQPWRVRVKRATEAWVDIESTSAAEAELAALGLPGVIYVFGRSAVRGDEAAIPERPAGVREDDDASLHRG